MTVLEALQSYDLKTLTAANLDKAPLCTKAYTVFGPVNDYTGYGQHTLETVRHLDASGYQVCLVPVGQPEVHDALVTRCCQAPAQGVRLVIQPLSYPSLEADYWFTMHETTAMPEEWLHLVNQAGSVIVPSSWNASCFQAQGVTRPISICPLGVDLDLFEYAEGPSDLCVFGAAANTSLSVAARKNIELAVQAFCRAFPREQDVELRIKLLPSCQPPVATDPRIKVTQAVLNGAKLVAWLQGLTAFVLPSRAEAWSFLALQAMACGKPVLAASFGGVTEFFNGSNGYPVEYKLVSPKECYAGVGLWAEPSLDSMVARMRQVYKERQAKGRLARLAAEAFSWTSSLRKLEAILADKVIAPSVPVVQPAVQLPAVHIERSDKNRDVITAFYRQVRRMPKRPLEDFSQHTLTNTPQGLGDTMLLTSIPKVAKQQGVERFIHHNSIYFNELMAYNPAYKLMRPEAPCIAADVLQRDFDTGAGHFMQRLQRAVRLVPDVKPKGYLNVEYEPVKGRTAFHFEAGQHVSWQMQHLHPRARQLYDQSQDILQRFVDQHRDWDFYELNRSVSRFNRVQGLVGSLSYLVKFLATCEYFIGIMSGPMHVATALGVRCIVIVNFPEAERIVLPTLVDIDQVESEWFYPQNVLLHQEGSGAQVRSLSARSLEQAVDGQIYPYWTDSYLNLDSYTHLL